MPDNARVPAFGMNTICTSGEAIIKVGDKLDIN
jgi:hypothetical protein